MAVSGIENQLIMDQVAKYFFSAIEICLIFLRDFSEKKGYFVFPVILF